MVVQTKEYISLHKYKQKESIREEKIVLYKSFPESTEKRLWNPH